MILFYKCPPCTLWCLNTERINYRATEGLPLRRPHIVLMPKIVSIRQKAQFCPPTPVSMSSPTFKCPMWKNSNEL